MIGRDETQLWDWVDDVPVPNVQPADASAVVAVMVVHNGAQWLPSSLTALAHLDARPGRIIVVDAGSTDDSRALLGQALAAGGIDQIVDGDADQGFGANVEIGLAAIASRPAGRMSAIVADAAADHDAGLARARRAAPEPDPDAESAAVDASDDFEWLWLLHDDLAPLPDALSQLLRVAAPTSTQLVDDLMFDADDAAVQPDRLGVLVPKLLHPKRRNHPDQIAALGETIARTGRAVPGTDLGDIDQQQLDSTPVLGGSTAGMLVALPVWRELGGLHSAIPLFRDGVEFGWRANERGITVRTVPAAALRHLSAGRAGQRQSRLAAEPELVDRLAGMSAVVMHSRRPVCARARLGAESIGRAAGLLLGKSPRRAVQTIAAWRQLRAAGAELDDAAARIRSQASHPVPAALLPAFGSGMRHSLDRFAGSTIDRVRDFTEDDEPNGMIDELTGDDFAGGRQQSRWRSPGLIGALIMLVLSVLASWRMFGAGHLVGPRLLPAPSQLSAAWQLWAMHDAGMPGGNPSWLGLMALGSTLTFGRPEVFVRLLLLGSVAFASWSAHHFAWRLVGRNWLAALLAALWGLAVPLLGVLGDGALDAVWLAILLPMLGSALHSWWQGPTSGAEGLRRPAAAGLWTAVIASVLPLFYPVAAGCAAAVARSRRDLRGAVVAILTPPLLLLPWLVRVWHAPARLLTGYDPAATWAPEWQGVLAAWTGRAATTNVPLWISLLGVGCWWAAGLIALLRTARSANSAAQGKSVAPLGWALFSGAISAPIVAGLLNMMIVSLWTLPVRPDPTPWTLLSLFCLFVLICLAFGMPPQRKAEVSPAELATFNARVTRRQRASFAVTALTAFLALWWVLGSVSAPLQRAHSQLPSHVIAMQNSQRQTQTLMVDLSGGAERYALVSSRRPVWGSGERPPISADEQLNAEVLSVAQQVAQGVVADDIGERLKALGIGHIWLRGASDEAIYELGASAELSRAQFDSNTVVFTIEGAPSLFSLQRGSTSEPITLSDHPLLIAGDEILLAQPADGRWRMQLDGRELPASRAADGRQSWRVEQTGTQLKFTQRVDWPAVLWQSIGTAVLLILIAPVASSKPQPKRALGGATEVTRSPILRRIKS